MANSEILKCSECQGKFKEEEMIVFDDRLWCEDCLSSQTTFCADCDERVYVSEVRYAGDYPICENCYDGNYFQCEHCERHYPQEDYGEDGCCRHCLEEYKPTVCPDNRRYYSRSRRDLPVGVEIEAEGGDYQGVYDDI